MICDMQQRIEFVIHFYLCLCLWPGCGEHLIRTMLAQECSAAMQSEDAHQALLEAMQNKFISESPSCSPVHTPFHTH